MRDVEGDYLGPDRRRVIVECNLDETSATSNNVFVRQN